MKKEPSYYAILPSEIRYDNRLSSSEKLFYAEVTALSNKTGECWASRKYFAELYDVAQSTVTGWTNNLCKHGYIDVDYEYDGKQIKKRAIKITNTCGLHVFEGGQNIDQGGQKNSLGVVRKDDQGWSENRTDNNTSINTTSKNNSSVEPNGSTYPDACEFIEEAEELANLLLERIKEFDPTHKYNKNPPALNSWILDIERAMRLDGREYEHLRWVINYLFTQDEDIAHFWAPNIQSGKKLREKFDTIKQQLLRRKGNGSTKEENIYTEASKL